MGQGAFTALPMLVAEELECDWRKVQAEFVPAHENVRRQRVWGNMSTGASRGISSSQQDLRRAGATAREMLIAAAAARWDVPPAECTAANSVITHRPSGRSLTFGAVAAAAAAMPAPTQVPAQGPDRLEADRHAEASPRGQRQGHRAADLRHRRAPAGHAACHDRAVSGVQGPAEVGRRVAPCRHEGRPPGRAVAGRGRGRRGQLVAGQEGRRRLAITWDAGEGAGVSSARNPRRPAIRACRQGGRRRPQRRQCRRRTGAGRRAASTPTTKCRSRPRHHGAAELHRPRHRRPRRSLGADAGRRNRARHRGQRRRCAERAAWSFTR